MQDPRTDETSEARHREAWERFMAAERREVEQRRDGQLSRVLGAPILAGETRAGLTRIAEEDRELAERGLVDLLDVDGGLRHKHVDDLVLEDRADRARAHSARLRWLTGRSRSLRYGR